MTYLKKKFVKVLEKHALNKDFENITNNDIIKDFLNTELNLFLGVELTIQSICAAAVKLSVESDVESLVSRYEKHLKVDRQMKEGNAEHEMVLCFIMQILSLKEQLISIGWKIVQMACGISLLEEKLGLK